jgi:hypothetical protein
MNANPWTSFSSDFWRLLNDRVIEGMDAKGWSAFQETTRDVCVHVGLDRRLSVIPLEGAER